MTKYSLEIFKHKIFHIFYICLIYMFSLWYVIRQCLTVHKKTKIDGQEGRVALVTGGGTGIGYQTAHQLLKAGMTVIIVGIENDQKDGVNALKEEYKDCVKFLNCDFSSLKSVRQLVANFKALDSPLQLLVNNAGIMLAPQVVTEEGFESHWVVNYLSHFLLSHLLLNTLITSGSASQPSRIVNVTSCLHYPGTLNFDDIQSRVYYSSEAAYTQSKLAMVMFACTLGRLLKTEEDTNLLINSVHPAIAFSGLYKHVWWAKWIPNVAKFVLNSPSAGSDTVVHAAISSEVKESGKYYENCQVVVPSHEAQSLVAQERLWQVSCSQAGIEEFGKQT